MSDFTSSKIPKPVPVFESPIESLSPYYVEYILLAKFLYKSTRIYIQIFHGIYVPSNFKFL